MLKFLEPFPPLSVTPLSSAMKVRGRGSEGVGSRGVGPAGPPESLEVSQQPRIRGPYSGEHLKEGHLKMGFRSEVRT